MAKIKAPIVLGYEHDISQFNCGHETFNDWLRKKALKNQDRFSKTYVVCVEEKVIGYYTLAISSIDRAIIPKRMGRNSPNPLGVVLLARLAVDIHYQRKGIARHLVTEAMKKTIEISEIAGTCGLLVHAIDDEMQKFYKNLDFLESSIEKTLILPLQDIVNALNH